MKIDFPILWVDDRKQFVDGLRPRLEKWIDSHGFRLVTYLHASETGIYDDLDSKEVELIILDYKLRGVHNGDAIITSIREKGYWESIIFYSTGGIPDDLFKIPPDGVFFSDKQFALERIKDVLSVNIRRASDLATLRGWVVADSIELEGCILRAIAKYFEKHETMSKARTMKVLAGDGAFFFGRLKEFLSRILSDHIAELTHSESGIFDFGGKHTILSGLVKDHIAFLSTQKTKGDTISKLKSCKAILEQFPKEVIATRNALAHQVAEIAETGHKKIKTKTKEPSDIVFTPETCVAIRKNVRKHMDNLLALEALI